ncbi:MAG: PorP/SprF family type IX secretion system membrane protein [Bacteroidetes bacterium]|nr:PorP/SprF family type IX secretion system membrane protein [Bacteroidota bacterium]
MKKLYAAIFLLISGGVFAQDIHFSEWWATPVAMNPALTGKFNGLIRGTFAYRNQWFLIPTLNQTSPYQTMQASVDGSIASERLNNNKFGVGLMFFNDKAGDGSLTTNSAMASVAYHQAVDRYGKSHLSFGLQAGFVMKQVQYQNLIFESQLDGFGWNRNINSGEAFTGKPIIYPDVNVGVAFASRPTEKFAYNFGASVNHIAAPRESFLGDESSRINRRFNVHGSLEINAGYDNQWTFVPTLLFMMQGQAQQYNFGLGINYQTTNEHLGVFAGAFGRANSKAAFDAAILNAGVDVYNARIGLAYDINISGLSGASKSQGALEASIVYIFKRQKDEWIQYPMYCPKF